MQRNTNNGNHTSTSYVQKTTDTNNRDNTVASHIQETATNVVNNSHSNEGNRRRDSGQSIHGELQQGINNGNGNGTVASTIQVQETRAVQLPPDWKAYRCESTGKTYYANVSSSMLIELLLKSGANIIYNGSARLGNHRGILLLLKDKQSIQTTAVPSPESTPLILNKFPHLVEPLYLAVEM